jgi:hypothetical protein
MTAAQLESAREIDFATIALYAKDDPQHGAQLYRVRFNSATSSRGGVFCLADIAGFLRLNPSYYLIKLEKLNDDAAAAVESEIVAGFAAGND